MNWKIEVKPSAEGQYRKLDKKTRQLITAIEALFLGSHTGPRIVVRGRL